MKNPLARIFFPRLFFCLYFFSFLLFELIINARAAELLGAGHVTLVYSLGLLCTGAGYFLYAKINRPPRQRKRSVLTGVFGGCFLVLTTICLPLKNAAALVAASLFALLFWGYIGGEVHRRLADAFRGTSTQGKRWELRALSLLFFSLCFKASLRAESLF